MVTKLDYAALSAFVYNNIKKGGNKLSTLPLGWTELPIYPNGINGITSTFTGFNARAYRNGTDIVIAYEGTDTDNAWKTVQDFMLGNTAGAGFSPQLIQAALFYEQVKAQYGSNITFTGHSLGGGLASVMGVWFGKSATTFAPAPFGLAAVNPVAIAAVQVALSLNLYSDSDFLLFNPLSYSARQANITSYWRTVCLPERQRSLASIRRESFCRLRRLPSLTKLARKLHWIMGQQTYREQTCTPNHCSPPSCKASKPHRQTLPPGKNKPSAK